MTAEPGRAGWRAWFDPKITVGTVLVLASLGAGGIATLTEMRANQTASTQQLALLAKKMDDFGLFMQSVEDLRRQRTGEIGAIHGSLRDLQSDVRGLLTTDANHEARLRAFESAQGSRR